MLVRELFLSDVTRPIPPVVHFHDTSPEKVDEEVSEYIITGGWLPGSPQERRVPRGIHEEYVHLLRGLVAELDKPGGAELPASWISGLYGSGKSSFAKLLGLALEGFCLPNGSSLSEALLARDLSPRASELREAWQELRTRIDPLTVIFDIGGVARDNESLHSAALRQLQKKLGYSPESLVADFELRLEQAGEWKRFEAASREALGRPWSEAKNGALAEEDFSLALSKLDPEKYPEAMTWIEGRAGTHTRSESPEEAAKAIGDMLRFRCPGATLFLVIDEVAQYVLASKDRVDRLRAFVSALGTTLRGRAWLLALGQLKLEEAAEDSFLGWAKDRFPPRLRVHLSPTNIRDVVHQRLLKKKPSAEAHLRDLFTHHRADLKLFALGCEEATLEDLVEVYPMLPGQADLLLEITSALRTRSTRAQGDDQAIRGLLQLLGELFREQKLAEREVGSLVTLDVIYEVQHTALDSDVQSSMSRILNECVLDDELWVRAAKAVALLQLVQEKRPTDARLVAQCLFDRVDRGDQYAAVAAALEDLRRRNLLGYTEKQGYRIQSSAGQEWEQERTGIRVPRETIAGFVLEELKYLLGDTERPRFREVAFPWTGLLTAGSRFQETRLEGIRDDTVVEVDFRWLSADERQESVWIKRSREVAFENRLVWVCEDQERADHHIRALAASLAMVQRYQPRRESLSPPKRLLLSHEESRGDELRPPVKQAIAEAFLDGRLYFRGRVLVPRELGPAFGMALNKAAERILPELYPHLISQVFSPAELMQLFDSEPRGLSARYGPEGLGIVESENGRYVFACSGAVPSRVQALIEKEDGLAGSTLLSLLGGPPFGFNASMVKASVAGLLRADKLKIQPESGSEITTYRDLGAREHFEKDRSFRRATFLPAGPDEIGYSVRARIAKLFEKHLDRNVEPEDAKLADVVAEDFPTQARRLRQVLTQLQRLPDGRQAPKPLMELEGALEACLRVCRQTKPTTKQLKKHLETLNEGLQMLSLFASELSDSDVDLVLRAAQVRDFQLAQLSEVQALPAEIENAADQVQQHLALERPWREIRALESSLEALRLAYRTERERRLGWQEQQAEQARGRLKAREGFATLTAEQAHKVLKPFGSTLTETTADAVAPSLRELAERFRHVLAQAETAANDLLDQILSEGERAMVVRVELRLHNREVTTEAEVEALLAELRLRLLQHIHAGARVRLV